MKLVQFDCFILVFFLSYSNDYEPNCRGKKTYVLKTYAVVVYFQKTQTT